MPLDLTKASPRQAEIANKFLELRDRHKVATYFKLSFDNVRKQLKAAGIDRNEVTRIENSDQNDVPIEKPEPVRLDLVEKHRYEQKERAAKATIKSLTERLTAAEDHRHNVLGLTFEPIEPTCMPHLQNAGPHGRQGVVLHLSDLHVGEVVNLDEMMGVNRYDLELARKRIARYFQIVTVLMTTAWPRSDEAPHKIYVLLGGDLISGHGLHPELAETDAGTAYEQCKHASQYIASGVLMLSLEVEAFFGKRIPIEVISVVGNHGRSTPGKPRAKLAAVQSYDTLVADFVEAGLREHTHIKHSRPRAFDAYFDVVGWPTLLTHGDRMSAGGGTGFIGPAANIVKGHKKIILTEAQQRRPVRFIFSGHFHTTLTTPWGFANGSGVGASEFAKSIRADFEPAQQNYAVFHEKYGLLRYHPIVIGSPDEGSIYSPGGGLILPHAEID